jgi:hypothetical protein
MKTLAIVIVCLALFLAFGFGLSALLTRNDRHRMVEAVQRVELACGPQKAHVFEQLWPDNNWSQEARDQSFEWAKNCQTRPQR